jgi:hypothetical protein
MPISGPRFGFTEENIAKAPQTEGVYALFDRTELIFYGAALGRSIRDRLQDHATGKAGSSTVWATHYCRETTPAPADRLEQLLAEFQVEHRRHPRCNKG